MAKRLLHTVLLKVLGEFIDLNEENLNLAVWSGQIVLTNLTLKTEHILKNFNLNVFHGSIQRLEVTIPWATLLVNPVKIAIDGILLDVGPLDIAKLGKVEALKRYMTEKLQKLKLVDQYLELSLNLKGDENSGNGSNANNNNPNNESYIKQWTAKVIDNIEIKVTDLHVRYEDSLSIPGRVFACGITLHSFGISTADCNWNIGGARKPTTDTTVVYKLAYMKCLGIYWQVDAASIAAMSLKEWERVMMLYIVKEDWTLPGNNNHSNTSSSTSYNHTTTTTTLKRPSNNLEYILQQSSNSQTREYILSPYCNSLTLKLIQNKKPSKIKSKFDIQIESSNLHIHIDSIQYTQLFSILDRLNALNRIYKPHTYRPYERPYNYRTSKAWWKYACKLAIRSRKYIDLVKLSLRLAAGREDPHQYLPRYALREIRYLEERLPFEPLRVGRQRAMLEIYEETRKQERLQKAAVVTTASAAAAARQQSTGWWGSWSSEISSATAVESRVSGSPVREDEDISIESIISALNEPEKTNTSTNNNSSTNPSTNSDLIISMFHFTLHSSSTAIISTSFCPIVQCNSALSLTFQQTNAGIIFKCILQDLCVLDRHTKNPPIPYIVSVKSDLSYLQRTVNEYNNTSTTSITTSGTTRATMNTTTNSNSNNQKKPTFSLSFERLHGKSKVSISALPIELCLNKECIQMLLTSFHRPHNRYAEKINNHTATTTNSKHKYHNSNTTSSSNSSNTKKKNENTLINAQIGINTFRHVSQNNDDIEIIFEAYAPKIIIPENTEDNGYLLLDCGYLEVTGFLGTSGMSMHSKLKQVSVGMPMTVRDMYRFDKKTIYLIKPFDILLHIQNIDQILAGMTITVEIQPEIRGEIDSIKLARLLTALGQVSGMFVRLPSTTIGDVKSAVLHSDDVALAAAQAKFLSPADKKTPASLLLPKLSQGTAKHDSSSGGGSMNKGYHPLSIASPGPPADFHLDHSSCCSPESVEFHTPQRPSTASEIAAAAAAAMTPPSRSSTAVRSTNGGGGSMYGHFTDESGNTNRHPDSSAASFSKRSQHRHTPTKQSSSHSKRENKEPQSPDLSPQQDPYICTMRIDLLLPMLALDLMYDVEKGYHLVLEVKTMRTTLSTRPLDRSILFEIDSMSMHDNFRADTQSHLIWTPPNSGKLLEISYINMSSRRSPLYRDFATDINMKFTNLGLNADENTIKHLRPFFEVLLASRKPPDTTTAMTTTAIVPSSETASPLLSPTTASSTNNSTVNSENPSNTSLSDLLEHDQMVDLPPIGTRLHASLDRISLDLLRTPIREKKGAILDSAFSVQISGMRCDVTMKTLMRAEVRLRSFEILDIRHISSDYVFKKVFCPAFESTFEPILRSRTHTSSFDIDADTPRSAINNELSRGTIEIDSVTQPTIPQSVDNSTKNTNTTAEIEVEEEIEENLLYVVFKQESKVHNHFEILFSDITSFIAIDTMLDFTSVALANVFALFSLLAAPSSQLQQQQQGAAIPIETTTTTTPTTTAVEFATTIAEKMFTPESKPSLSRTNSSPKETFTEADAAFGNTMSVVLRVRNPRLIFLEDPSSEESQAIVGTCGVQINYTRETKTQFDSIKDCTTTIMFDSLHITLSKYEVYVLKNMMKWYPQPILEPIEVELHLKRRVIDGITKMTNLHIELDDVVAQVSFNDILLAQSILSRRMLSEAPATAPDATTTTAPVAGSVTVSAGSAGEHGNAGSPAVVPAGSIPVQGDITVEDDSAKSSQRSGQKNDQTSSSTEPVVSEPQHAVVSIQFGMSLLSMVVINDFNGQSIPIIKTTVSNSHFGMESIGPKIDGAGALDAKVDFFNSRLSTWEPLLDTWQPTARIYSLNEAKIFEIKSEYTMQLTLSGILLESLLRSYSLFFHDLDVFAERTALSGITVENLLGEGLDVMLLDSGNKEKLVYIPAGQAKVVNGSSDTNTSGKIWSKAMSLPSAVDLHFLGSFRSQRMPLFHLPFNINKPKAYNLQPTVQAMEEELASPCSEPDLDSVWTTKATKVYVIEPIVEEVYENSRYDPIMGCWRKPYMMGDPYEWTDGSGTVRKDIESIELTSDRWEWQGNWEIDMDGIIGKDIDAEGWEYANSFRFFTMVNVRRCSKALDGCRRRRWTRTRIPVASSTSLLERPLTLFWDVHSNKNGSRRVELRSALQISNHLSYPIMLCLQHSSWDHPVELGPVACDTIYSVPLIYSYASSVRIRPVLGNYDWSPVHPCNTHTYDFTTSKNSNCVGIEAATSTSSTVWFRIYTTQSNKSVQVNIVPYFTMTNKLLCDMKFVFVDRDHYAEEGEIESGCEKKVSFINIANSPMLAIKVGNFEWSERILLNTTEDSANLFELHLPGRKKATKLYLSMNVRIDPMKGLHIEIFSKVAIIDHTSLHIFVASKLRPNVNIVRSTCSTLRNYTTPATAAATTVLPPGTVRERIDSTDSLDTHCIITDTTATTTGGGQSTHLKATDSSNPQESWGMQLKLPSIETGLDSLHLSAAAGSLKGSKQQLHLAVGEGSDTPIAAPVSNPVVNTYTYTSSFPTTPTIRVDATQIHQPKKPFTGVVQDEVAGKTSGQVLNKVGGVEPSEQPSTTSLSVLIRDILVSSRNKYHLYQANRSQRVYTDHAMRWYHLPPFLTEQLQLRTPYEDRVQRSNKLIQFTTTSACMIFILVDIRASLKWLSTEGFIKIREIATARCIVKGALEEHHFAIYGKIYERNQHVVLRTCWNKVALTMYSLFFLPLSQQSSSHLDTTTTTTTTTSNTTTNTTTNNMNTNKGIAQIENIEHTNLTNIRIESLDSVTKQLQFKDLYNRDLATRCWTEGSNNLTLMYTYDNIITIGLCKGKIWSKEINIDTRKNAATKGSFEVENYENNISYQLSYGLHTLPGLYSETQIIYFMPRYCILNCTEEVLLVSQRGSEKYLQYLPYRPEGWHKLEMELGTAVQLRTESTLWSLGAIDINDIGSSVMYISRRNSTDGTDSSSGSSEGGGGGGGIVLHIEVKLADPTDYCSVLVIIWQETVEARAAMSIRNTSDVSVAIRQADIELDHEIHGQEHLFEIIVPPNTAVPFGWADPECGTDVLIAVGDTLLGSNKRIASINLLKTEQLMRLPYNFGRSNARGEVIISVATNNSGHVLEISNLRKSNYLEGHTNMIELSNHTIATEIIEDMEIKQRNAMFPTYGFNFLLSSFGISIVVEKPIRREFISLYVDWLEVLARFKGSMRSLEFIIMDLQVDNYSETMIYPVLLRSRKKEIRRSVAIHNENTTTAAEEAGRVRQESTLLHTTTEDNSNSSSSYQRKPDDPFVKVTIIQEIPTDSTQAVFKYVACRILPLAVEVDSATVQLLFTDLLDDLKILTHSQALALSVPDLWLNQFNYRQLRPQQQLRLVNVYQSKIQAQQSKIYFKNFIIHPIKITFTFAQTTYPRRQYKETLQSTVLNILMSLVGVEMLKLHLRSFEVQNAMESVRTISDMILSKSIQDVRAQLTQIAGSLTMLGSPIGFARRVGSGVKAFFYEPYQGAVQGSGDFFIGLGRGTSTLFTGVVSGAMDSAVAIVGTASKGMSHLSGDADYVRKRAMKRQQSKANRGGILEGMREGGESVLSGFSSGVSGLVSKPIEEASKSGFHGFFKGLGLGIIGAAVKPMIGLSDGLTSVAQGISNQVDPGMKTAHVRPPRALEPSAVDATTLVIVPLNLEAAFAQEFVMQRAKQNHYDDSFLRYIALDTKGEAIILSHIYVYWRRKASLWGRVWANISHCVYMHDSVGIMLYSGGKNGGASFVKIPCNSVQTAKRVYAALALNTSRMGNPSNVIPVDVVLKADSMNLTTNSSSWDQNLHQHTLLRDGRRTTQSTAEALLQVVDESQLGALDGYRFGTANGAILAQITGSEEDILKRAKYHLEKEVGTWARIDQHIWRLLWEWGCIHSNLSACRCSVTLLINRSDSPIQITRVQLLIGRNVLIIGSNHTGYEVESRSLLPEGMMLIFICAFPESPLDIGHLKANINTAAFHAVIASTQRESLCESKGSFTIGFLEKTVSDWWSKYVIVIS